MKRIALVIGQSGDEDEFLPGVKVDVMNYRNFLLSPVGGLWYEEEIEISLNEDIYKVLLLIDDIREGHYDFAFVVFTGHGFYSAERRERGLWFGDYVLYESGLRDLAPYELLILDTCAGMEEKIVPEYFIPEYFKKTAALRDYRDIYESALRQCDPQEIILYASSPGEYAADTAGGGLFSKALLQVAYNNSEYEVLSALMAWKIAYEIVIEESRGKQHPYYYASVRSGRKLPFSIRVI